MDHISEICLNWHLIAKRSLTYMKPDELSRIPQLRTLVREQPVLLSSKPRAASEKVNRKKGGLRRSPLTRALDLLWIQKKNKRLLAVYTDPR